MLNSFVRRAFRLITVPAVAAIAGCATQSLPGIPLAPVRLLGPEPTFTAERQCHGGYKAEDLARFLPRARLAMTLPETQSVALDSGRGCLTVNVHGVGSGRLAELALRGVGVPRRAVLLRLVNQQVP